MQNQPQFQPPPVISYSGPPLRSNFFARFFGWFLRLPTFLKITIIAGGVMATVGIAVAITPVPTNTASEPPTTGTKTPAGQSTKEGEATAETPAPAPAAEPPATPPAAQAPAATNGGGSSGSGGTQNSGGGGGSTPTCALPNYPNASCTGVPAGVSLATITGDVTVTTDGTVIDGKNITGCLIVQAANVTIRNSKITCTSFYGIASYAGSDDGGLLVEDVEIDCDHHNSTGISYQGLTARRVHIHGCENGLDILSDVSLSDSYIHDIYEGLSGHGDGIQASDGSNVTINHNTIYGESTTSAININNHVGGPTTTNMTISNNLLAGGAYTLYCPIEPSVNFTITGNHFSTIFYPTVGAFGHSSDCAGEIQSGNVIHETGQPITLQ